MASKGDNKQIICDSCDGSPTLFREFVDTVQIELNRNNELYVEAVSKELCLNKEKCIRVVILMGIPGSGKTTFGKTLFNTLKSHFVRTLYLSSDEFRGKLGTSENDQSVSKEVFRSMREHLKLFLENTTHNGIVFIDATNLKAQDRNRWFSIIQESSATALINIIHMNVSLERALINNMIRGLNGGRTVPTHVIENMYKKLECHPDYYTDCGGYTKLIKIGETTIDVNI